MKRNNIILSALFCLLLLMGNSLFAVTDIAGTEANIVPDNAVLPLEKLADLNFSLDLSSVSPAADVGFSSVAVNDFFSDISTSLNKVSLNTPVNGGKFSNQATDTKVYLYWRILSGKNPVPSITLTMNGPMKNAQIQDKKIDWTVSWVTNYPDMNTAYKLDSSNTLTKDLVFENDTDKSRMKRKYGSVELVIETNTPYWSVPAAVYSAELTVEISGI